MRLIFTVTNDLNYDQRMQRICSTMAEEGHDVLLVGRNLKNSKPLTIRPFEQKRLRCFFQKGFCFYAEYNLRLFFFLLFARFDALCSIDLDTLPAGCCAAVLRRKKRVFDAHEYFTEVPEVVNRPFVRLFWRAVARIFLPFYRHAYTVGPTLANIFTQKYRIPFAVVRNVPVAQNGTGATDSRHHENFKQTILYQGALNEGRGITQMLDAMQLLDNVHFVLAGEGDLSQALRERARALRVQDKVTFLGYVMPDELKQLTASAWLGLNLLENKGQSYYYSLANKFYDCVQAKVPVLTMNFPEYATLNREFEVGVLLLDLETGHIVKAIQMLQSDRAFYLKLQKNCAEAAKIWHWEAERNKLIAVWESVFSK